MVLGEGATDHWDNILNQEAQIVDNFKKCGSINARNTIYEYLAPSECIRPKEEDVINHGICTETLLHWTAKKLEGMTAVPGVNKKLKIFVQLYHQEHVLAYKTVEGKMIEKQTIISSVSQNL